VSSDENKFFPNTLSIFFSVIGKANSGKAFLGTVPIAQLKNPL
jgi:hypothetical protein